MAVYAILCVRWYKNAQAYQSVSESSSQLSRSRHEKIANVAFAVNGSPVGDGWKRIGCVYYDKVLHDAKILLRGWRQGLCIAAPFVDDPPFLQGDIVCPVYASGCRTIKMYCGFITTGENRKQDTIYTVVLEAMPLISPMSPSGFWLRVLLQDADVYEEYEDH